MKYTVHMKCNLGNLNTVLCTFIIAVLFFFHLSSHFDPGKKSIRSQQSVHYKSTLSRHALLRDAEVSITEWLKLPSCLLSSNLKCLLSFLPDLLKPLSLSRLMGTLLTPSNTLKMGKVCCISCVPVFFFFSKKANVFYTAHLILVNSYILLAVQTSCTKNST